MLLRRFRFRLRSILSALLLIAFSVFAFNRWRDQFQSPRVLDANMHHATDKEGTKEDGSGTHMLTKEKAQDLCKQVNWDAVKRRDKGYNRRIYDLFLVNTELDWLEIRLNELYQHIDYFVVAEANTSFTGRPKPFLLKENWDRFSKFHEKLIYHEIIGQGENERSVWDHEGFQRDTLLTQAFPRMDETQAARYGDVILVSDIDEIPRLSTLTLLRNCAFPRRTTLRSRFYYYSFQWLHRGPEWDHPQATYYQGQTMTIRPDGLRLDYGVSFISKIFSPRADVWNASWHCSSCYATIAQMQNKIQSFSHVKFNRPEFKDPPQVVNRVRNGLDLFDRVGQDYDRVEGNPDVPGYLKENAETFSYMLDRDPPNANFRDYVPPT